MPLLYKTAPRGNHHCGFDKQTPPFTRISLINISLITTTHLKCTFKRQNPIFHGKKNPPLFMGRILRPTPQLDKKQLFFYGEASAHLEAVQGFGWE